VRYALELATRRFATKDDRALESINKGRDGLRVAVNEVRRISRDLRPGVLDDLGLGPALKTLMEEFRQRTQIETRFETVVFSNRLDTEAKTALYRVAQEALTNVERHAQATKVSLKIFGHRRGITLRIEDDGIGIEGPDSGQNRSGGLGLRNMQERIEYLSGNLHISSSSRGTVIEAEVPLTHMLAPQTDTPTTGIRKENA
jgi:two-component system, NarL family, sensor kinase